jgi:hypothetical protein
MTEEFNKTSHLLLGNGLIKKLAVRRQWLPHLSHNNRAVGSCVFYAERIKILVMDFEETEARSDYWQRPAAI